MKGGNSAANLMLVVVPVVLVACICLDRRYAYMGAWALLQWSPIKADIILSSSGYCCTERQAYWERLGCTIILEKIRAGSRSDATSYSHANGNTRSRIELPFVDVQKHRHNVLQYLEENYGKDWRRRPVLFKGLWTKDQLTRNSDGTARKLSLGNLLQMDLEVPYFVNASTRTITPDGHGSVGNILNNITMGKPHKIGTQLIIENNPDLIEEVAPLDLVTDLFGEYFTAKQIKGSGPWNIFPAITTVPVFVANHGEQGAGAKTIEPDETSSSNSKAASIASDLRTTLKPKTQRPFTTLHCEPIGNIAVQLSGRKKWTLVQPEYSFHIKPGISPDGRAFFASWANESDFENVPTYEAVTAAGDAMWVPTWTWHQVDYIESEDIAFGASLFHFRFFDFVQNNALFAVLIIPAMVKELLGFNTQ